MLCDVLTGRQTLDQAAVEFPPGGIVDIPDVCIWLVESGITDQALPLLLLRLLYSISTSIPKRSSKEMSFIRASCSWLRNASDMDVSRISMSLSIVLCVVMVPYLL